MTCEQRFCWNDDSACVCGNECQPAGNVKQLDQTMESAYQEAKLSHPHWRSSEHVAFESGWSAKEATDSRIDAWLHVADHEVFNPVRDREQPLLDSVLDRLSELADLEATVHELAPAVASLPTRETIAQMLHEVTIKWSGPAMAEFRDAPPTRKQYAMADAVIALFGKETQR